MIMIFKTRGPAGRDIVFNGCLLRHLINRAIPAPLNDN